MDDKDLAFLQGSTEPLHLLTQGLTKRELFAALALNALLSNHPAEGVVLNPLMDGELLTVSIAWADALIEQLNS